MSKTSASARSISRDTAACWRSKLGHPWGYRLEWYTIGTVVLNVQLAGHAHLSEIAAFKLYVFVYNYSSIKPQEGGLIVVLLTTPLSADLLTNMPKCPWRNTFLSCYINCIIGYNVSVKLAQKPLNMVELPTPQIIKFNLLATPLGLQSWKWFPWLECRMPKFSLAGYMQRTCIVESYFTLSVNLPMSKCNILTLGPNPRG